MIYKVKSVKFGESIPNQIIRGGSWSINESAPNCSHLETIVDLEKQVFWIKDKKKNELYCVPVQGNTIYFHVDPHKLTEHQVADFMDTFKLKSLSSDYQALPKSIKEPSFDRKAHAAKMREVRAQKKKQLMPQETSLD